MTIHDIKSTFKSDSLSGFVVFLVAVPLCLGIALASGAPLFSGLISGIVGGMVVGIISKSPLSVSGPAAGLTAICLAGITKLGSFELFLLATILGGGVQLILAALKAGGIAYYFPSNVIKGMLTGIGIIIILKQLPHLIGYDRDTEGDDAFFQADGENTFSAISHMFSMIQPGAAIVGIVSLIILFWWDKYKPIKILPGALLAVLTGLLLNTLFTISGNNQLIIESSHLVNLPVFSSIAGLTDVLTFPDFSGITNKEVWIIAFTLGIVASLESLLTIEATDKLDPLKRNTPTNRELLAQGIGNITSGFLGGLPITSVIVRSSANLNSGAKSKLSTIIHGVLLLIGGLFFAKYLNQIPLAALAAILIATGWKLANPKIFKDLFSKSKYQYIPFIFTVIAVVFTNLLTGVLAGLAVSITFILIGNLKNSYYFKEHAEQPDKVVSITLAEEVSFLNKAAIRTMLANIAPDKKVIIDATNTEYIDYDVLEIIKEFQSDIAPSKNISVVLIGFKEYYSIDQTEYVASPDPNVLPAHMKA